MTRPRKDQISLSDTPYYHIVSRCVRRTFLCGLDPLTQHDYEHRRQWIVDRIRLLSSLFAVDLCAYAIMSNHYHLTVKLNPEQIDTLTDQEVINRWLSLHKGSLLVQKMQAGETLSTAEYHAVGDIVTAWRQRLSSLSWFMKCLNEPIARRANKEDECTGHFWEARFKSQALRSDEALLANMVYVDLNPVRAGIADKPENADYTSIQERITPQFNLRQAVQQQITGEELQQFNAPLKPLLHFSETINDTSTGIPLNFTDYLTLVDWTGRAIWQDKRGYIAQDLPPILQRLNIDKENWLNNTQHFESRYWKALSHRVIAADTG